MNDISSNSPLSSTLLGANAPLEALAPPTLYPIHSSQLRGTLTQLGSGPVLFDANGWAQVSASTAHEVKTVPHITLPAITIQAVEEFLNGSSETPQGPYDAGDTVRVIIRAFAGLADTAPDGVTLKYDHVGSAICGEKTARALLAVRKDVIILGLDGSLIDSSVETNRPAPAPTNESEDDAQEDEEDETGESEDDSQEGDTDEGSSIEGDETDDVAPSESFEEVLAPNQFAHPIQEEVLGSTETNSVETNSVEQGTIEESNTTGDNATGVTTGNAIGADNGDAKSGKSKNKGQGKKAADGASKENAPVIAGVASTDEVESDLPPSIAV